MSFTGSPPGALSPYLGREAELDRLQRRLADAAAGRGGLVLLRGPGGMGTTRTAHELAARADRAGVLVLWGESVAGLVGRPYGALAEALEEYGMSLDPAQLAGELAADAPSIVRLAPRLGPALRALSPPAPLAAVDERLRLRAAIVGWLKRAVTAQPLLFVLDDLDRADADALGLVEHIARHCARLPVLLLATTGTGRGLVDELVVEKEVVDLPSLDEGATQALLAQTADEPISTATVALVQTVTDGVPLYARELYHHLRDENLLDGINGRGLPTVDDLPETLEALIAWRLARLGPEVRAALTSLAAFHAGAPPALLAEVSGVSRGRAVEFLELAAAGGFCRSTARGQRYVISHERIRGALLATLSATQRQMLHRRVALALETELGDEVREHAGELLHHYHASAGIEGGENGIRHGLLAAEQARSAYSHGRAADCLRATLALAESSRRELRPELLGRLAQAEAEADQGEQALATAAAALAAQRQARLGMSETIGQLIETLRTIRGDGATGHLPTAYEDLRRQGLEQSSRADDLARVRLELLGEHWEPLVSGSVQTLHWVHAGAAVASLAEERAEADRAELLLVQRPRARPQSAAAAGYARSWRQPATVLRALRAVVFDLLSRVGLYNEAASWGGLYLATSQRYGSPRDVLHARLLLSRAQAALGHLAAAGETAAEAQAGLADLPAEPALDDELLVTQLLISHYRDGDWDEWAARLAGATGRQPAPAGLLLNAELSVADARLGRESEARARLPDVLEACALLPPLTYHRDTALLAALAAAWELGAAEHAARGRSLLELAHADGVGGQPHGTLRLGRARMLSLAGDVDEARSLLAEERPALEAAGLRPLRAILDHDEAVTIAAAGAGNYSAAAALLEVAAEQFETLGMHGWHARTRRLLDAGLEQAARPGGRLHFTYPLGLSRREADIIRLLADGQSLGEAAATLDLDLATAQRHRDAALAKLGLESLEALPRTARRYGLGGGV
jgi:DNA-binding CsgD family transcriptional regulator